MRLAHLLALLALWSSGLAAAAEPVWHRLLVELDPPDTARVERIAQEMGGRMLGTVGRVYVVEIPDRADMQEAISLLRRRPGVRAVQVEMRRPPGRTLNDPQLTDGWHLATIGVPAAWDRASGEGVVMAVCDTGTDAHPDLDLLPGWNTFDGNANSGDVHGHGTKVAGSVAMSGDNGIGGAGVAYRTRIMPMRVTDANGWGYDSAIAACITRAADMGARGANVSFGGVCGSPTVISAAAYMRSRGGIVTASSGNSGALETTADAGAITCVGATNAADARTGWSTQGPQVDVVAPGDNIFTTTKGGGYGGASGTSFSAPVTLGVYALMLHANPKLGPAELDRILFETAVDLGTPGRDPQHGHGRIDAAAAVARAAGNASPNLAAPRGLRLVN
jgi:thermitase